MNAEKYTPSPKEIKQAEEMMTPEQSHDSMIRAENWEQEQDQWLPFEKDHLDENFKRKLPTQEQITEMDQRLNELGDVFAGADFNWQLDGALNISLMNGDYIGYHKDVDLSVEEKELRQLESHLEKRGYGLFLSRTNEKTDKKIMRRVGYRDFHDSAEEHPLIGAIDESGKILQGKILNYADVHIIKRNEKGQALGRADKTGVTIPDKWTKSYPIEFHGQQINLSHPGKLLYYKLHEGRNYDLTDIDRLVETGRLSIEDILDVERVIEDEFAADIERANKVFETVAIQITPEMGKEQIFDVLVKQPEIGHVPEQARAQLFLPLAQKIYESDERTAPIITSLAIEISGIRDIKDKKIMALQKARQTITDSQQLQKIRERIER